jgi:phage terminase small subunit
MKKKQRVFVEEYLQCWNASEAARRAGYNPKAAPFTSHRMLKNVNVAAAIRERLEEKRINADEVLVRLTEQARSEQTKYMLPDGSIDLARLLAEGKGHLIKSIKENKYGKQIEFHDAQAALALLGKFHSLFTDRIISQVSVKVDGFDELLKKIYEGA